MSKIKPIYIITALALLGVVDSFYLTYEHFVNVISPCSTSIFIDCGRVLRSKYSEIFGTPLALIGLVHYTVESVLSFYVFMKNRRFGKYGLVIFSTIGLFSSAYFVYLQLVIIRSICLYCMASALISFAIFYIVQKSFYSERKRLTVSFLNLSYRYFVKQLFFLTDAEKIHDFMTTSGQKAGNFKFLRGIISYLIKEDNIRLRQNVAGIPFKNPIGLAAGFDYEAKLTQFLPSLGFGYMTVGTITNLAYGGNPKPRLGRLPKSKSLLVNKGFKSSGAKNVAERLSGLVYDAPIGVSIGRSNSPKLKTQKDSVKDIVKAFKIFEQKNINNSYYELNISCPNLIHGNVSFYTQKNLNELLTEVKKLKIKKPIFVKMPIDKSDKEILAMLKVIDKYSVKGVIFGNLQKDKKHPSLDKDEVNKFKMGFYSGKPTYDRSNELISLSHKHYKDRFVIVGCGGVFSGKDAFEKISRGASLIQLITGLIYEGPQLVQQINFELLDTLEDKGFRNIKEAVGVRHK